MAETAEDLGIQYKIYGVHVHNTSEDWKSSRGETLSHRLLLSSQISDWHGCLLSPTDLLLRNAMTVCLVPEGVSVTARMCLHSNIWGLIINIIF